MEVDPQAQEHETVESQPQDFQEIFAFEHGWNLNAFTLKGNWYFVKSFSKQNFKNRKLVNYSLKTLDKMTLKFYLKSESR